MYCKNCGSFIDNDTHLCPNCNSNNFADQPINSPINHPTKKKKTKVLVSILSIAIAIAITVVVILLVFSNNDTTIRSTENDNSTTTANNNISIINTTEKNIIYENKFGKYYLGSSSDPLLLKEDGNIKELNFVDTSGIECNNSFKYDDAYDNETIFSSYGGDELLKFTFTSETTVVCDTWVDTETLKSYNLEGDGIDDLIMYDNEIYFKNHPSYTRNADYDYYEDTKALQLGKINKDGTSIELFDNINPIDYVIYEGWIYYYDNGYNNYSSSHDKESLGIYKIKIDGTEKTLLYNDFQAGNYEERNTNYLLCDNLKIFEDKLYFIDYSKEGNGCLRRISLDGTNPELLTKNPSSYYTVDITNNNLYYSSNYSDESNPLYKLDLSSTTETVFLSKGYLGTQFTVYNDYLYFFSPYAYGGYGGQSNSDKDYIGKSSTIPAIAGKRCNLTSAKVENIMHYYDYESVLDTSDEDITFINQINIDHHYYWEDEKGTEKPLY